jgi:hypothetical protein
MAEHEDTRTAATTRGASRETALRVILLLPGTAPCNTPRDARQDSPPASSARASEKTPELLRGATFGVEREERHVAPPEQLGDVAEPCGEHLLQRAAHGPLAQVQLHREPPRRSRRPARGVPVTEVVLAELAGRVAERLQDPPAAA